MKASLQFAAILFGIFAPFFLSSQRPAPCLCIPNDPAWATGTAETQKCTSLAALSVTAAVSPLHNKVVLEVKDDPSDLDKYDGARYKAFWMWGDGNFRYFDHGDKEADLLTYKQAYTYSQTGKFIPVVILTEKKSDKAPPGRMERAVQINDTKEAAAAFEKRLNVSGKTADIFSTEELRADSFHTAMVVSAPKSSSNTGLFFFYNSIYDKGKKTYKASLVHQKLSVEVPAYATRAGLTIREGETKDIKDTPVIQFLPNGTLLSALSKGFQHYFFLEITPAALNNMPAGFDEYRFFPVLETIWPDTLSEADFLALVVGTQSPYSSPNDDVPDPFYDAKRIENIVSTLTGLATDYDTTGTRLGLGNNFEVGVSFDQSGSSSTIYVRGIARESAKLVGSIDPNELEVKKICPLNNGKYKVTMRLQICNEGYMFENSITVRLVDAGDHFSQIDIPQTIMGEFNNTFREDTTFQHLWSFVWGRHLEGIYDTTGTTIEYAPSCAEFDFTIETDWAGVQKLQAGKGLEMCVTFSNSIPEKEICGFFNFPIRGAVTQANGYACGDDCWCNWLCWLIIIVVILLLLFLWWYKKQQNNTP